MKLKYLFLGLVLISLVYAAKKDAPTDDLVDNTAIDTLPKENETVSTKDEGEEDEGVLASISEKLQEVIKTLKGLLKLVDKSPADGEDSSSKEKGEKESKKKKKSKKDESAETDRK